MKIQKKKELGTNERCKRTNNGVWSIGLDSEEIKSRN